MKTYNWEGVNPDGYFLDKLEPIPSALSSFQKLFQVSATALSIPCFFQAAAGIRDRNVTGVQTCALPIYPSTCLQYPSTAPSRIRALSPTWLQVRLWRNIITSWAQCGCENGPRFSLGRGLGLANMPLA